MSRPSRPSSSNVYAATAHRQTTEGEEGVQRRKRPMTAGGVASKRSANNPALHIELENAEEMQQVPSGIDFQLQERPISAATY